jgi:hypothetical protein
VKFNIDGGPPLATLGKIAGPGGELISLAVGGYAMGLPNGLHHIAICTRDIKKQIEFYTQAVGMELVALYGMHGVERTFHGFVRMGNSSIAFVQSPEIGEIQTQPASPIRSGPRRQLPLGQCSTLH